MKNGNRQKLLLLLILLAGVFIASCGTGDKSPAELQAEFEAVYERYRESEDPAEKADLMDSFATENPDAESAGRAIGMVVYNRFSQSGDSEGALAYLNEKLEGISSPAVKRSVNLQKLEILAELGRDDEFSSLANQILDSSTPLSPGERKQILDSAVKAESWDLSERLTGILLEEMEEDSDPYTKSSILMQKAWAEHKLGRTEEALQVFEMAAQLAPRNYAGYYEYPVMELEYQWATALLEAGKAEEALGVFEPRALFVKEENKALQDSYQALLKDVYLEAGRDEASFDAYKAQRKEELATQVPEFSAPDAGGTTRSFSEIRGDEATLLVFWFPT